MISQRPPLRVVFFGDSIFYGQHVSPHGTWVTRLSAAIGAVAETHGRGVTVANPSITGNQTRQALERMPKDVQDFQPDLLAMQFGMNDCNYWMTDEGLPRVSPAAFLANLREIIQRGRTFGAQQVVLHTNHPTTRHFERLAGGLTYEESNRQYNRLIREVAASGGYVTLVDIEAEWRMRLGDDRKRLEAMLLEDRLHLSAAGHELYFEITEPIYSRLVSRALTETGTPVTAS